MATIIRQQKRRKMGKVETIQRVEDVAGLEKISTGIAHLDSILNGGVPRYSINIIAGPPGTGKTILAQQALFHNAGRDATAPYLVTVSEPMVKMLRYQQQFSFFDPDKLNRSVHYLDIGSALMEKGLDGVSEKIHHYIEKYQPSILAIDSIKAIHEVAETPQKLREFAYRLAVELTSWECTAFLLGEYDMNDIGIDPVFAIADGIIFMHREDRGMQTLRHLEVVKMRGDDYFSGRHPFVITPNGIRVFPRIKTPEAVPHYEVATKRLSSGVPGVDEMMKLGIPEGTVTLVAGGSGTGKTLLSLHFLLEGIQRGEPGVLVTFQETPSMLKSFSSGFGWNLDQLERKKQLKILYSSPVEIGVDQHTDVVKNVVADMKARRVVIDSLKDIEIATPDRVRFKDYVYSLVNYFRAQGITCVLTNEIPALFGDFVLSEAGISFVADNVILLRYVEMESRIARAISVLKMRGSDHAKDVREYKITSEGMKVLEPFKDYSAVLAGTPTVTGAPGLPNLPPRAREALRLIDNRKRITVPELAEQTGQEPEAAREVLVSLAQMGYVIRIGEDGNEEYKKSVVWS